MVAAYWPTLASFPATWLSFREHGFVTAGLMVWLIWRHRERFLSGPGPGVADLIPVIGLASLAWLAVLVMDVQLFHQALFVGVLALWGLAVGGWGVLGLVAGLTLTASLALPILDQAVPLLQRITTVAAGGVARFFGISADIGYTTISIEAGTFLVNRGCAGLNFLWTALVLAAVYAHLFTRRWQVQVAIVAFAGFSGLLANWFRVAFLIFVGAWSDMQSPMLKDHMWEGWAIFVVLMIPSYLVVRALERHLDGPSQGEAAASLSSSAGSGERVDDPKAAMETEGDSSLVPDAGRGRLATLATMAAVVGPLLFVTVGVVPRGSDLDRDPAIFAATGSWSAIDPAGTWSPSFRGFDERQTWTMNVDGIALEASRLYYVDQQPGQELIQFNNHIAADDMVVTERTVGPIGPPRRLVREALVRAPDGPRVVWYWYRVAGIDTPFDLKAKVLEIFAFFRRTPAAELLVVSAPCGPDDCVRAAMAMRNAMGAAPPPNQAGGG